MSQLGRSAGLTGFLDLCREVGLDAYLLAAEIGLPGAVLTDPDLRVSVELMGRMLELAAERSGVEDFALRLGETRRISNMGAVGLVIREQPTLRKALAAYGRYQWLQNDAYSVVVQEFGDHAILRVNGPAWQGRQAQEITLATATRTIKAIMGEAWRPQEVWFTHAAPLKLDTYRRVFGITPSFDQDAMAVVMRRSELDTPIASADPVIARQVALYLERLTEARSIELRDKVGDLIVALLPDGVCSVERVAQHLGMDRRTLHRRLSAEGVTFSGILDDTRRGMAVSLLTSSDRPLQNVADLLGFSSLSAFAHWFRRHFAQSASAYRASHVGAAIRPSSVLFPAH
jgi:AraC-like DNA-binding protein